jgi:UDP-glucose 4,6-dehydratase
MYYCASETNVNKEIQESNKYKLIKGNLCDYDVVYNVVNDNNIDYIIHFAAQSHVQNSFDDALQYTKDNIVGTHNLLEVCRKYGKIKRFIHVSTDEVYGESMISDNEDKKNEESILCPTNPYAATKAGAELIAQSYYHSFNLPIIITRGNNVYGSNQYPEKIIPRFIKQLKENKKVTIQGDGSNVRAFIHVMDVARAFTTILEKGEVGEIYNIGSDDKEEYSVLEIAKILIKKIKKTDNYLDYIEYIDDRPFNDKRYYISNEKIKKLGWNIIENFDDGINNLIADSKSDTSTTSVGFSDIISLNQSLSIADEDHANVLGQKIIISVQQGKNTVTKVENIPEQYSLNKLLKTLTAKNMLSCGGHIAKDKESKKEFIVLQGNFPTEVSKFLVEKGLADAECIICRG